MSGPLPGVRQALLPLLLAVLWLATPDVRAAGISVTDDAGRVVYLERPAARIVTLEPFLADLVYAVGAGDRLVGVSSDTRFPFEVFRVPKVRSVHTFILEQLRTLKPDLVLAWAESIQPGQVEEISNAGVAVFVAQGRHLNDAPQLLRTLAKLTATDGEPQARAYEQQIAKLRADNLGKPRITAMVELRHRPLITVSAGHFMTEALDICGADNVFAGMRVATPPLYWEQLFRRPPYAIVGFGSASGVDEFRENWRPRQQLEAVREGRLAFVPADIVEQVTTRTPEYVASLCRQLDRFRR